MVEGEPSACVWEVQTVHQPCIEHSVGRIWCGGVTIIVAMASTRHQSADLQRLYVCAVPLARQQSALLFCYISARFRLGLLLAPVQLPLANLLLAPVPLPTLQATVCPSCSVLVFFAPGAPVGFHPGTG